jgi:hypothetical protein
MTGCPIGSTDRTLTRVAAALVAAAIVTCPAPGDARSHILHNGFRSPGSGLRHSILHSSYPCSVFGHRPCIPYGTFCSVFSHHPCLPDINYPIGQDLRLTIESRAADGTPGASSTGNEASSHDLNTISDVFSALRACWVPPAEGEARSGTQMTVRLSFKRDGDMIAQPRVTYVTPGIPSDLRQVYWDAVTSALRRCTPLPFTAGLGGALAGRPFAIRFVDDRAF